jgi:hypothetical protein
MTREAKRELAQAYNKTVRLHEASYDKNTHLFRMSWSKAASQACKDIDLIPLVYAMAASGFSDYADWAAEHAGVELRVIR